MSITINYDCDRFCANSGVLCVPNLVSISIGVTILFLVEIVLLGLAIINLNSFLAKNESIASVVLVVERWLPDYAIEAAMAEFNDGNYKLLISLSLRQAAVVAIE